MIKSLMHKWARVVAPLIGALLVLALLIVMLVPAYGTLGQLGNAFSSAHQLGVSSGKDLIRNVSFLPEKLPQYALHTSGVDDTVPFRIISALFGILAVAAFYALLKTWQTKRIALLGTLLFMTSSWFLHQSRFAEPQVLYLSALPMLLLAGTWLQDKRYDKFLPISAAMIALCLYLPGLWLFIAIGCVIVRKDLLEAWQEVDKKRRSLIIGFFSAGIAPLFFALASNVSQIPKWLGLPSRDVFSLQLIIDNLYQLPQSLFINGPDEAIKWLVGTPILDVFTIALVILGSFSYYKGAHTLQARILALFTAVSLLLIIIGGAVGLSILIPILYLVAANGLAFLLQQWFTVFPRNPFARAFGVFCILIAVSVTVFYHVNRYYVAWPHATTTKQIIRSADD